jgi:Leucine-rich repeat (LRR) protein
VKVLLAVRVSPAFCACILLGQVAVLPVRPQAPHSAVKTLEISGENAELLGHLQDYPNLEVLSINCIENLQSLPDSIGALRNLKELRMDNGNGCSMNPVIPESIGNLHSLEKLILYGAQDPRHVDKLDRLPKERHRFPKSMSQLKNLTCLDLGRNGLEEIPDFVKGLPKLRELDFAWNMNVKTLPPFLTELKELQTLRLDADGLTDLPDFLNQLPKLSRVILGDNCKITQSQAKRNVLKRRFQHIKLDFRDEYDCLTN